MTERIWRGFFNSNKLLSIMVLIAVTLNFGFTLFNFRQSFYLINLTKQILAETPAVPTSFPQNHQAQITNTDQDVAERPSETIDEAWGIYERQNQALKERSLKISPDGTKKAYFKDKFIFKAEDWGDSDYTSLIVEKDGREQTVFQDDFHLGRFEWLNDEEIKAYKNCGSNCLLGYVINIETRQVRETWESPVFLFEP